MPFFNHSGLPLPILGEVWQISDPENSGFLTPERFGVACRLIGHAQAEGGVGDVKPEWLTTRKSPRWGRPCGAGGDRSAVAHGGGGDCERESVRAGTVLALEMELRPQASFLLDGELTFGLLRTAGPLPCFEGFAIPAHLLPPQGVVPPRSPIQAQGTGGSGTTGTAGNSITPEEKAKYAKLFAAAQPVNGLLDGTSSN